MTVKADSELWTEAFGTVVYDPDGWDRSNFEESWAEEIDADEYLRRWGMSTVLLTEMSNKDEAIEYVRAVKQP